MSAYKVGVSVQEFPLADFAPDLALNASSGGQVVLIDMDQAMPTAKGYQAQNLAELYCPPPLASMPLGATVVYYSNGTIQVFAGDKDHLWALNNTAGSNPDPTNTWNIAENTGAIPPGVGYRWRFSQFGDTVIAVNRGQPQPLFSTFDGNGHFAAIGGGAPTNASLVTAVNGQVLMFNGANWYCSALATFNNWTPNIQTQAGQGVLYDFPGEVVACSRLYRNVIAFKPSAMWLGSYVGGQAVWSWQLLSDLTGTWTQEAVIEMPDAVAFFGIDDFYVTSGYTPQRIPNNLKEWFFDVADPTWFGAILSRYDPYHGLCYWYFVSKNPPVQHVPDRYVCWNTRNGKWGAGFLNVTMVPTPNFQSGSQSGNSYTGGVWNGLFFGADNILKSWTGAPGTMMLRTSYIGSPKGLSQCMRVKPQYYVEPKYASVLAYHARNLGGDDIPGPTTFRAADGWFYFRQYDKWHSFQINTEGPGQPITPNTQHGGEVSALLVELRPGGWR